MSLYARVIWGAHRLYKLTLSPWFGRQCRFLPTCSDYAAQALTQHGLLRGSALAAWRLCRCHPFGGHGYDPVPPAPAKRARKRHESHDPTDVSRRPGP